jgi:fibronectin type III domain protein
MKLMREARRTVKFRENLVLVALVLSLAIMGSQAISPRGMILFSEQARIPNALAVTNASPLTWPPGNLTAVGVTSTSLVLTWPNASAVGYRIQQNNKTLNTIQGNLTSYYATNLNPNASYTFQVYGNDGTSWVPGPSLIVNLSSLTKQPLTITVPGPQIVQAGTTLTFAVNATGPNVTTENVSISASGLPVGALFPIYYGNPISATFAWTPTSSQGPGNYTIIFHASDTLKSPKVTGIVSIHVTKARKSPVLNVPGPQSLSPGSFLSFAVVAADPNLPPIPVTVSAAGLPDGSTFNYTTGVFRWIAACSQPVCDYVLTFTAENQDGVAQKNVAITVNGSPAALLPTMAQDYLSYIPWAILAGVVVVAAVYALKRRRGEATKRDKLLKRAIGDGVKPDGVQHQIVQLDTSLTTLDSSVPMTSESREARTSSFRSERS